MSWRLILWLATISMARVGASPLLASENGFDGKSAASAAIEASARVDRYLADEVFANLPDGRQLAPQTSDAIFLRRVYLDLVGQPPTPDEVKQFVRDPAQAKRSARIEALLSDPRFGVNAGHYWRDVLLARQNVVGEGPIVVPEALEGYLSQQLNDNVPWDKIVRSFVEATGPIRDHGESALYIAQRFDAIEVAGEISRIFLGIQIQCAQCHDHPTDRWKRLQLHEFAAFFPRVGLQSVELTPGGRREQRLASFDDGPLARTDRTRFIGLREHLMPDPKAPNGPGMAIAPAFFVTGKRLEAGAADMVRRRSLAEWLTARDNPWFARAFVNRLWFELVGEGFYEPVDDIGPDRRCSAPQTLDYLAGELVNHNYDVKWLYRTIVETEAYQRESRLRRKPTELPFTANVSQPLRADQLGDVLRQVTGIDVGAREPLGIGKTTLAQRSALHRLFGYDPSVRRQDVVASIPQVLMLMNSEALHRATTRAGSPKLAQLLARAPTDERAVVELYLQMLAREPSAREQAACLEHVKNVGDRADAFEDLFWSLVNSEELRFRN